MAACIRKEAQRSTEVIDNMMMIAIGFRGNEFAESQMMFKAYLDIDSADFLYFEYCFSDSCNLGTCVIVFCQILCKAAILRHRMSII